MYDNKLPDAIEIISEEFRKLPGVGKKSAVRMAFGIIDEPIESVNDFADRIKSARSRIRKCSICGNICYDEKCGICSDETRTDDVICVVEDVRSLLAVEKVEGFNGKYHVLGGTISPLEGKGPDDINIPSLVERVRMHSTSEVIVATNPTVEGESTALYISKILKPLGVKVTRIGYGIPMGGDLDYTDEMTLSRAVDGRVEI